MTGIKNKTGKYLRRLAVTASAGALMGAGFALADVAITGADAPVSPLLQTVKDGQPMHMEYELEAKAYLLFIPATGRASFDVKMNADNYLINSRVKVTGIADWFVNYDMTLQASGYTHADRLDTYFYRSQNKDGKKNRRVELTTASMSDLQMTAEPRFGNLGDPAATPAQAYEANDPLTALITFALEPRAEGEDPCGGPLKIFDGRQLTHLHLKNAGTAKIKVDAWKGEAIECHVTMDKVAGYKTGEADNDNLSGIDGPLRMYLAPLGNGAMVPVKIVADTDKIGKVTLQAKKLRFTPIIEQEVKAGTASGG